VNRNIKDIGLLLAAAVCAASMWFYVQQLLIPHQVAEARAHDIPRGNLSDLYPRWLGARELLLFRRDPYSMEVTREIQAGYYGRPLDDSRRGDPTDQQAFAYPVYVVFLLAPSIKMDFAVAQACFHWALGLATISSVLIWMRALRWQLSPLRTTALVILTAGSFAVLQGIKLQQLTLLVAALIAVSILLIANNHLFASGLLLAFATIKPQLVLPLAAWLFIWTLGDFRRRQSFVWGFVSTLFVLIAAGEYVLPEWPSRFYRAVLAYRDYTEGAESILEVLTTPPVGKLLAALIVLLLAGACWRSRYASSESVRFHNVTALLMAATVVITPKASPYNQTLLIPSVFFALQHWRESLSTLPRRTIAFAVLLAVVYPWLASVALWAGSIFLSPAKMQDFWVLPLYTSLLIPPAVALLLTSHLFAGKIPAQPTCI
jgi:hypothetical protein